MQESFRRFMTEAQQRQAATHFAEYWAGKGYEKGESQKFWLSLLGEVYGVEHPAEFISFEDQVHLDHTSFIDGHIRATRVLIESGEKPAGENQAVGWFFFNALPAGQAVHHRVAGGRASQMGDHLQF